MHRSALLLSTVVAATAFTGGLYVADGDPGPNAPEAVVVTDDRPAPSVVYPEVAPTTTVIDEPAPTTTVPVPDPMEVREALTQELVDALNQGDLDLLLQLTAEDPRADARQLEFLIDHAPFWFEDCFEVSGGVPKCNATSEGFGLTLGFNVDDTAIDAVDGAYNDGL